MSGASEEWAGLRKRVRGLEKPLTPGELAELEGQIGVRLPEEYRRFLLLVGAGGAGPAYGVFPVRRGEDGRWAWHGDGADLTDLGRLAEPFPTKRATAAELAAMAADCPEEEDFEDIEEFDAAFEAWDERWAPLLWGEDRTVGALCLCHLGCALRQWLVVSGPAAGQIWDDERADDLDLRPAIGPDGTPLTFATWYDAWLRESARKR
ncbi:SMI1/KNR4 family protein [Actinacidiphila glaucinigra]|uniref:SMI1/KNR4 family protein n=1 Tax=Actinacidiphila glaucinigra TaxID=235986 RepID=UPI0033A294AA